MAPLAVVSVLGLALAPVNPAASPPLRVMSFNVRYGTADDGANSWEQRRDLVFSVIGQAAPDLIGTQEALRFQLDELREALPGYGELGVGRTDGDTAGEYTAILYRRDRLRVEDGGTFWLSDTPEVPGSIDWGANLPRICTWGRFVDSASATAFYVYNVHFDHESQQSRERSAQLLLDRIAAREHPDPVIVTGDFNAGEHNPAMQLLTGDGARPGSRLRDSFRIVHPDAEGVGTFHGFRGTRSGPKIDAVLVSGAVAVDAAAILRDSRGDRYPSDHFPVTAVVRIAGHEGDS